MIDFHCHMDLYKNPLMVFNEVKQRNTKVLAVTTSPRAYLKTLQYFNNSANVKVALGFHPELVADRKKEIGLFMEQVLNCKYIGEVGIDGTGRNRYSYSVQKSFFYDALSEAEKNSGRIISIHSRCAVNDVLECIEKSLNSNILIMHWFTGSIKELQRSLALGCWFSINPKMCNSKAGRDIIMHIPLNKILPETDAPFTEKNGKLYMPWDTEVIEFLSVQYRMSMNEIENQMENNLLRMCNCMGESMFSKKIYNGIVH